MTEAQLSVYRQVVHRALDLRTRWIIQGGATREPAPVLRISREEEKILEQMFAPYLRWQRGRGANQLCGLPMVIDAPAVAACPECARVSRLKDLLREQAVSGFLECPHCREGIAAADWRAA